jgi:hypothetical protein
MRRKLIAERFGESRVVEDPHLVLVQVRGHSPRVADLRQSAKNQHPVPAAQYSRNLSRISLGQKFNVHHKMITKALFGSGYAGLGVQKLQTVLHAKAKESPDFCFHALYDKVYRVDVLAYAYERCKANAGAAGVDDQTLLRSGRILRHL